MIGSEDSDLVQQVLRGETRAFERLVEKYQRPMFNAAYRIVNDSDEAADVTQSAFVKAYERLGSYDQRFKFFSWMYRIVVNEALNALKRMDAHGEELHEEIPSQEVSVEETTDSSLVSERLQEALLELDIDHRVVIILRHFHNLTYDEISQVLDIPEKTVKSRLFSARSALRKICIQRGIV